MPNEQSANARQRFPWFAELIANPDQAINDILLGIACLPSMPKARPFEALSAMMADLPREAPEWTILDHHLYLWIERHVTPSIDEIIIDPSVYQRLVRATAYAVIIASHLSLSKCQAWLEENVYSALDWEHHIRIMDENEHAVPSALFSSSGHPLSFPSNRNSRHDSNATPLKSATNVFEKAGLVVDGLSGVAYPATLKE